MAGQTKAIASRLEPGNRVTLYTLDGTNIGAEVYRFHSHMQEGPITWQGKVYDPWPIKATGFATTSSGKATTPRLEIANVNGKLTAIVIFFDDLIGAKFERRRTLVKFLDGRPDADPTEEFPTEVWTVNQKISMNKNAIVFELASPMDFKQAKLPARHIIANQCPWKYRGTDCGYTGGPVADKWDIITTDADKDDCSKLVKGCKFRFGEEGELRHGGFPAAGLIR